MTSAVFLNHRRRLGLFSVLSFAAASALLLSLSADVVGANGERFLALLYLGQMALLVLQLVLGRSWLSMLAPDQPQWLQPPMLITAWVLLFFGVPGFVSLVRPELLDSLERFTVDPVYTVRGTWLIVVGCFMLWLGYGTTYRTWKTPSFAQQLGKAPISPSVVMGLFVVLLILQAVEILVVGIAYGANWARWGALASFRQWVGYLKDFSYVALALVALNVFGGLWPRWMLALIVGPLLGLAFVSGFMKPMFWIVLLLWTAALFARVNPRYLALFATVFVFLGLLVVPVAEGLRARADIGLLDPTDPTALASTTAETIATLWTNGDKGAWLFAFDRTLYRNAIVAATPGIILEKTPSFIPYQGMDKFLAIPAYVIPRALWPDKPVLSRGNWFAIMYLNQPEFVPSSAAITVFGEGYMYAGWLGVVLACFILGVQLAWVYRWTASAQLWAIYLALIPTFIDAEAQFTGMFVASVQRTVVFLAVYALLAWLTVPKGVGQRLRSPWIRPSATT
ncbi:MAG: hypothetical protein QXP01_03905 [Candidatus Hadarchaeum sp.]